MFSGKTLIHGKLKNGGMDKGFNGKGHICSMEKKCPICGEEMKIFASGSQMPSVPFIKIPTWIQEVDLYKCIKCSFIGLWHTQ